VHRRWGHVLSQTVDPFHDREVAADHRVETNPTWKCSGQSAVAFDPHCRPLQIAPSGVAKVNPDQIGDLSLDNEIDLEAGVFGAHIRARLLKDQPKRAKFQMIGRYARKLKTNDYPMVRQCVQSCALSESP
jgi:hypothetical protein